MTVEDVFSIRGRGTVVTGRVETGTIEVGDEINIRHDATLIRTVVTGIERLRKVVTQAQTGDKVGVLLRNVTKEQVAKGDMLVGV
jgi:elongation factor Tu